MSVNFSSQTGAQHSNSNNSLPPSDLLPKCPVVAETHSKGVDVICSPREYSNKVNSSPVYSNTIQIERDNIDLEITMPLGFPTFKDLLEELSRNKWTVVEDAKFVVSPSGNSLMFSQIENAVDIASRRLYTYDADTGTFKNYFNEMSFEVLVEKFFDQTIADVYNENVDKIHSQGIKSILSSSSSEQKFNTVNSSPVYFPSKTINNSSAIQEEDEKYTKKWSKIQKESNSFSQRGDFISFEDLDEKSVIEDKMPLSTALGDGFPHFEDLLKELSRNEWAIVKDAHFVVSPSGNSLTFEEIKNAITIAQIRLYTFDAKTGTFKNDYNEMSFEMLVERYYNQSENDIFS